MALDKNKYNRVNYQTTPKILEVSDLRISFKTDHGIVHAVRGVSFDLYKGETLCIVGESGSGKSVTSKTIMGILSQNAVIESGTVMYEGEDLTKISEEEFHKIRGHKIGMIFQDPLSSLNPIMKIGQQITEAMLINRDILKQRYESIISPELVAYKNAVNERKLGKSTLIANQDFLLTDEKKKLADAIYQMKKAKKSFAEIFAFRSKENKRIHEEYRKLVEENKPKFKELDNHFNEVAPALKKALEEKKKEAKKEVKAYHKQVLKERDDQLAILHQQMKATTDENELKELKAKEKQVQDEYISKTRITKQKAKEEALKVMKEVGIPRAEERFYQYPFEFSGGMRQRIVIAIALTANPDVLICDEPTTALDVTIQAQILELINKLKKERNMSIIFITHDLGVVANMADRVAVMYAGKIVEVGTAYEVFFEPQHPYTWALLSSIPDIDSKEKLDSIPGTPPNLISPPKGDAFAERNKYAMNIDFLYEPPLYQVSDTHFAATWLLCKEYAPEVTKPKIVTTRIEKALQEEEEYESGHQS